MRITLARIISTALAISALSLVGVIAPASAQTLESANVHVVYPPEPNVSAFPTQDDRAVRDIERHTYVRVAESGRTVPLWRYIGMLGLHSSQIVYIKIEGSSAAIFASPV